ncbi:MAG: nucleotide exchange factor GrpE [Magnetococcales bacterium]|nr:nucleotide exchange factor GrpE [Magnetococcales bacterium]MBF0322609.1 nucleotide exchange factor GrpE [Magnetococcales bacterium]
MNGQGDETNGSRQESVTNTSEPVGEVQSPEQQGGDVQVEPEVAPEPAVDPEERVRVLEEKVEEWRQAYLRSMADMDNLRKRTAREMDASRKFALEGFAKDLLLVADNLDRALSALEGSQSGEESPDSGVKGLLDGVTLVRTELLRIFNKHGVTRIESLDQPFDPNQHQAMIQVTKEGAVPGSVVQEFQAGYLLHQRLLRPALVAVAQ